MEELNFGIRGEIMKQIFIFFVIFIGLMRIDAYAAWSTNEEIITGSWGSQIYQFFFGSGDSFDDFPKDIEVDIHGRVFINDDYNFRIKIYNASGLLEKMIIAPESVDMSYKWPYGISVNRDGALVANYEGSIKHLFNKQGELIKQIDVFGIGIPIEDGFVFDVAENEYALYSFTGTLLQTYRERPLEIGSIKTKNLGGGSYKVTVTYPDKTYHLNKGPFSKYIRDDKGYINAGGVKSMEKFDACGKSKGYFIVSDNEYNIIHPGGNGFEEISEVVAEYGSPVVAPNGDIYVWKRTPEAYSILKWTWLDSPTDPKGGPDAPLEVQANSSISGVYLTWNPSPQDPGCVAGYDIERATSADGIYSKITTVPLNEKQTYHYDDTSASAGQTWYYRVKATSDIGDSDAAEASAARP